MKKEKKTPTHKNVSLTMSSVQSKISGDDKKQKNMTQNQAKKKNHSIGKNSDAQTAIMSLYNI